MRRKSLVIVDHTLVNTYGHQYQYAKNLTDACKNKNISVRIYVNKTAANYDLEPKDVFIPFFDLPVGFSRLRSIFLVRKLSKRLFELLNNYEDTDSVRYFVPNLFFPVEYIAWIIALKRYNSKAKIIFLLRYDIRGRNGIIKGIVKVVYRIIFRLSCIKISFHELHFATDSKRLIPIWQKIVKPYDIFIVPIPLFEVGYNMYTNKSHYPDKVVITIIGNLERRKGADTLHKIISVLLSSEMSSKYYFNVQCRPSNSSRVNRDIAYSKMQLKKLASRFPERLILLDKPLSIDELIATYMNSDIIFMPYDKEIYKNQTSNVLAESMVCGRVVIVPDLTWMADIVSRYKNGIIYRDDLADNIAKQIETAVKNFTQLSQNALRMRKEFAEYNNPKKLVDSLFAQ